MISKDDSLEKAFLNFKHLMFFFLDLCVFMIPLVFFCIFTKDCLNLKVFIKWFLKKKLIQR